MYQDQQAALFINNELMEKFKVRKSTRQACSLFLLLFVMVLEYLLKQIRKDVNVKGLNHKGFEYKLKVFADDIMFILEDPVKTPSHFYEIKLKILVIWWDNIVTKINKNLCLKI